MELYDVVLEGQKESPAVNHGLLAKEVVPSPGAPFETPPRLSVASPEGRPAERQLRKPEESLGVPNDLLAKEGVTAPGAPFGITIADMLRGVKDAEENPYVGEEYRQSSARQSEDYDPGAPKTWPAGPGREGVDWMTRKHKDGSHMNLWLYLNRNKGLEWLDRTGTSPKASSLFQDPYVQSLPNEADLDNLRASSWRAPSGRSEDG